MSAIRIQEAEHFVIQEHLNEQLMVDGLLQETQIECAKSFLLRKRIYDVTLIEEVDFRQFKRELLDGKGYIRRQVVEMSGALRRVQKYWIEKEYGELLHEIERCTDAETQLFGNIKRFLIRQGIHHLKEVDYLLREKYEQELAKTRTDEQCLKYLKAFDRVKQYDIRENMKKLTGMIRNKLTYNNQIIFLPYLPNQELAMEFDKVRDKNEWIWDFKRSASEILKRQVFSILIYILDNMRGDPKGRRVRFLLPLQWLYEFCVEERIADLERLELYQIEMLKESVAQKVVNYKNAMQIVDNCRKILFLNSQEIHWNANVWYIERFQLSPERINPSNPVMRISFYEVSNKNSRALLQEYVRYQIGITGLTIGNIRTQLYDLKKFLEYFTEESSIFDLSDVELESYFIELQEEDIKAETYNKQIINIWKFYQYFLSKERIKEIPFELEYYLQKTYPVHYDRTVEEAIYMEILNKLHLFPEVSRLIFLHLWCTGLRISEVCTLKGDAYYWDGEDAWIKVYQIKMKADKLIPIPLVLYRIMDIYIQKNKIQAKSYLFKSTNGGAYRVGSFYRTFKANCERYEIANSEYVFKSHDYRHTLATRFYDDGVSIQTIRDYLGHVTEDMTKQYIDYLPKKITKANEEYFNKPENNLAAGITVKKRGEKDDGKNPHI